MRNSDRQMTLGAVYDRIQKELESKEKGQALKVLIDAGVPDDVAIKAIRDGDGAEQLTEVLIRIAGQNGSKLIQNALIRKAVSFLSNYLGNKTGNEIGEKLTEKYLKEHINSNS